MAASEKIAILRRHLLEKVPVSDLCDEFHHKPTAFYRWQKEFFENGAAAFDRGGCVVGFQGARIGKQNAAEGH